MKRGAWAKYLAFGRIGARTAVSERGELLGRMAFFAAILGVFSALWRAVAEAGMPIVADPRRMVWYLATTEWILLSAPQLHTEIQEEVRRGDIVYRVARPVSYVGALFAQSAGMLVIRAPVLAVTSFACAYAFTKQLPPAAALVRAVPLGLAAMVLVVALYVTIGLLSFWLSEVAPVYWVSQKLLFVLGGLMLPLQLYPTWLRRLAACTPFPSMLEGPAAVMLGAGPAPRDALWLGLRIGLWLLCALWVLSLLLRRATRSLSVGGG
ncbi:MAG: ABC-2 family transporter protein [Polyangiaceae bacterium]|jgi:viologen exporter family transport system permease protein